MVEPAKKRRQGGRILPSNWLRSRRLTGRIWPWEIGRGCAICHTPWSLSRVENGRAFCWTHDPDRAQAALTDGYMPAPQLAIPDRKTCERILRLAGRTKAAPKPPRPKKQPRDRRYVR